MHVVVLNGRGDLGEWRNAARRLLAAGGTPEQVDWRTMQDRMLFPAGATGCHQTGNSGRTTLRVKRSSLALAEAVTCHTDPGRFALLYRLLVRLQADSALL